MFPSEIRDEVIVGEIHDRVIHLQRHWTKMRDAVRQVNDGEGLLTLRCILSEAGKPIGIKDWSVQEPVIDLVL